LSCESPSASGVANIQFTHSHIHSETTPPEPVGPAAAAMSALSALASCGALAPRRRVQQRTAARSAQAQAPRAVGAAQAAPLRASAARPRARLARRAACASAGFAASASASAPKGVLAGTRPQRSRAVALPRATAPPRFAAAAKMREPPAAGSRLIARCLRRDNSRAACSGLTLTASHVRQAQISPPVPRRVLRLTRAFCSSWASRLAWTR